MSMPKFLTRVPGIVRDDASGNFSHTKLWSNIGHLVITIVFVRFAWTNPINDLLMLTYAAIMISPNLLGKLIGVRFGGSDVATPPTAPTPDGSQFAGSPLSAGDQQ